MQNQDFQDTTTDKPRRRRKDKNILAGLVLLLAGTVLMIRQVEADLIPKWVFTWPMILIVVGFFIGLQTRFRDFGWLILMGIGTFFLSDNIFPDHDASRFIIPVVVFGVGLILLLSPGRKKNRRIEEKTYYGDPATPIEETYDYSATATSDALNVVSIFGNVKKVMYTKDLKGGEIVSIFGGAEINLTQADFKGPIVIEVVQVFGGTKLIVPPHWSIRSEAVAIFGGIEDKRPPQPTTSSDKVLILQGTALFAGIEIRSF
ncbi:LiaF domain-containing protein [Paraflavitalea sp. CAU 1676]|uniref:LiaF transmembrane domain-containing protein n=1 Tax=Paraflavitalea sp. CAU 1676 TaxID=3032598 RepID=UPI0023D9F528|nr:LiaF domain-containing protein [Paraflavitalea sp. CAU 1676]MDF2193041.1 LiaF-related protein [Paraflavitalea sp. CAU 1676]